LGASEVELELRPHTVPADFVTLVEVKKEELQSKSEEELVEFALNTLGIILDSTWPRTRLLDHLLSFATQVVEY
jgi:hypothetical protein